MYKMYEIVEKEKIAPKIYKYKIYAPLIVKNAKPGQFVIVIPTRNSERIPLTIHDYDDKYLYIIFQVVGKTTLVLSKLKEKDIIFGVLGPLGQPAEIENFGKIVCVGGGVGTAVIYPEIKALKKAGNFVYSIIGARTKELLILENEVKKYSDKLIITTDDGSYGIKGVVTNPLKEILITEKIDRVIAIGPIIMMKFVAKLTKEFGVKTLVSLNPIMVDGTGMCGGCRVDVGGEIKFACVDGPEFDAHLVDFEKLLQKNRQYDNEEKCKLDNIQL